MRKILHQLMLLLTERRDGNIENMYIEKSILTFLFSLVIHQKKGGEIIIINDR